MIKKLASLFLLASTASYADVEVKENGEIGTTACVYGRGQVAIIDARNTAIQELASFVSGTKSLSLTSNEQSLDTVINSAYKNNRHDLLEGLQAGSLHVDVASPYLEGSDTCLHVSLDVTQEISSASDESELIWDDNSPTVTVTVVGEGWPENNRTAREKAEKNALHRAISRVVGVYLSQNSIQTSQSSLSIINGNETNKMQDVIGSQMVSNTHGLVKSWQPLAVKKIKKEGVEVTLQVIVEKAPLIAQTDDLLAQIGSPTVKVIANKAYAPRLKGWLAQQGIEMGPGASLMIEASHKLIGGPHNKRLTMEINVSDLTGNVYGHWKNDSSLVALPDSPHALDDLLRVNFRMPGQEASLQKALRNAFINVVEQGGLVRSIKIKQEHIQQPEKLHGVLSTIGGAKDVSIYQDKGFIIANLRYPRPIGELAAILKNLLQVISNKSLGKAQVLNEQTILFK
ncbi:MAG: hypothetical protein ACI8SC_000836 [Colwellia sp.]|jgi:hypothetical protein